MSYCVDKGFLKADSIDNAKKMVAYVAAIPGGVDTRDGDKREAMGREGNVLNDDGKVVALEKKRRRGCRHGASRLTKDPPGSDVYRSISAGEENLRARRPGESYQNSGVVFSARNASRVSLTAAGFSLLLICPALGISTC